MYAKHFPDTQLCPVSKRICFVYILMECGLLPIFPLIRAKKRFLAEEWDCTPVQMISAFWLCKQQSLGRFGRDFSAWVNFDGVPIRDVSAVGRFGSISIW